MNAPPSLFTLIWQCIKSKPLAMIACIIFSLFVFLGVYAPLFASSKPLLVYYDGALYFPLFRTLFYKGFYTKPIDIFYNLLMFTLPCFLIGMYVIKKSARFYFLVFMVTLQIGLFIPLNEGWVKNPEKIKGSHYTEINTLLRYKQRKFHSDTLSHYLVPETLWQREQKQFEEEQSTLRAFLTKEKEHYEKALYLIPTLREKYTPIAIEIKTLQQLIEQKSSNDEKLPLQDALSKILAEHQTLSSSIETAEKFLTSYRTALVKLRELQERKTWLEKSSKTLRIIVSPFFRPFHWEDDAGGSQDANQKLPWWELTRINRKDLGAALLFGIRISLVVGILTVAIALMIGIPFGAVAGYFAGAWDILLFRLIEVWEGMPAFFMLLLTVALLQTKSIFLIIFVLALFGWTHFARFMRAEVLKQRNLSYVMAGRSLGFNHGKMMFSHILPNAIPPILTLLPFSIMAAITSEAGLSFLGLGEEGSTSWGVLMAEGRSVFPGESYLLWPPAILLTLLLVSIALIGDAIRDALDPKMR